MSQPASKPRILIIDDSEAIHMDFRRVLKPEKSKNEESLDEMEQEIFGMSRGPASPEPEAEAEAELDTAHQGQEGIALVRKAQAEGRPYTMVFLDYQMPPGWNGVETLRELRKVAPTLPVVFISAYSNYSWEEITEEFGISPLLLELRKPIDSMELRKLILTCTEMDSMPIAPGIRG